MKKSACLVLTLGLGFCGYVAGQAPPASTQDEAKPAMEQLAVRSGTKVAAELESTVDARTAKPGDEVAARVTKDVKQGGEKVIRKGDRLVGRVESVEQSAEGSAGSQLSVTFDRLVRGDSTAQLNTVLTSVVSTPAERRAQPEPMPPMPAPAAPPRSGSASAGGGLLGGVSSTVGSTVGVAGSTVGGVGATADAAARGTAGAATSLGSALPTPLSAIRIGSEAQGDQQAGAASLLSTKQGHLRLESGTRLQFQVKGEAEK